MLAEKTPTSVDKVASRILFIRGKKVLIDADLAQLYEVSTAALNQAMRRNRERFPEDFVFQLTSEEKQEVVTSCDHLARLKYSPNQPHAYTEHGAIMAASVLNSARAVEVSVFVVRAFVQLREVVSANKEITQKLTKIEQRLAGHDQEIQALIIAFRQLMAPHAPPKKRQIGFRKSED
ncbi:MAG: ORF6N domain-containing protein [Candidatus Hydrogenedentes bacterium]|nr:ORF6N domain-containing protein [Candidatus Hydrogenedentota bacterium]